MWITDLPIATFYILIYSESINFNSLSLSFFISQVRIITNNVMKNRVCVCVCVYLLHLYTYSHTHIFGKLESSMHMLI